MKRILPIAIASIVLLVFLYFPTLKTTQVSYSETTKDKYTSSPTPQSAYLKTYKNETYNLLIEYPNISLNPQNKVIECGNFISSGSTFIQEVRSEDGAISLDNLAWIQVIDWDKSVGEYLIYQGAQDLYNVSAIMDSGAKQALSLNSLKTRWKGEGTPPLWDTQAIYKKDGLLFLVTNSQFLNEGCLNPAYLKDSETSVNRGWKIENHLRFY